MSNNRNDRSDIFEPEDMERMLERSKLLSDSKVRKQQPAPAGRDRERENSTGPSETYNAPSNTRVSPGCTSGSFVRQD